MPEVQMPEIEMPDMIVAPQAVSALDNYQQALAWPASVVPAMAFAQWQLWLGLGRSLQNAWRPYLRS